MIGYAFKKADVIPPPINYMTFRVHDLNETILIAARRTFQNFTTSTEQCGVFVFHDVRHLFFNRRTKWGGYDKTKRYQSWIGVSAF
jgi:hypothetical protein